MSKREFANAYKTVSFFVAVPIFIVTSRNSVVFFCANPNIMLRIKEHVFSVG